MGIAVVGARPLTVVLEVLVDIAIALERWMFFDKKKGGLIVDQTSSYPQIKVD